ncbi:hypothetical protein [Burkholderia sp. S171]|uniref:hypothetical protein n=1 Tax=Burkholderia sp. S171 TaxID=1641860 RepID=UPI00131C0F32|nr:hypothetical protein [Burkholderia sp. S171]
MIDIELEGRWNFPTLTVGDEPILIHKNMAVYELLSAYQDINVKRDGFFVGRYKHVALRHYQGRYRAYAFDFDQKQARAPLGLVNVYKR